MEALGKQAASAFRLRRDRSFHLAVVYKRPDIREQLAGHPERLLVVDDQQHFHLVLEKEGAYLCHRYVQGLVLREAVCARGQQRESYRLAPKLLCQPQRIPITGRDRFAFTKAAAAPCRADSVDDVLCVQIESRRIRCLARDHLTYLRSGRQQFIASGRLVYGKIDAPADRHLRVRGVDYRVSLHIYYVVTDYLKCHFPSVTSQSRRAGTFRFCRTPVWQRAITARCPLNNTLSALHFRSDYSYASYGMACSRSTGSRNPRGPPQGSRPRARIRTSSLSWIRSPR